MLSLASSYNKVTLFTAQWSGDAQIFIFFQAVEEEEKMTPEQLAIKNVGKQDPKRHLEEKVDAVMTNNIVQCLGAMLDTVVFK